MVLTDLGVDIEVVHLAIAAGHARPVCPGHALVGEGDGWRRCFVHVPRKALRLGPAGLLRDWIVVVDL